MPRQSLIILCLCIVLVEGRGRGRRKWRGSRGRGPSGPSPAPPIEKFEFAEEIDASQWEEKIESVANFSLMPQYFPFVMFHVSTCQYCKHTLPEFEMAAKSVKKAQDDGQLKNLPTQVKYFMFQCDKSPKERLICDKHPGVGLPMLKLFRDRRVITFGKERWAKNIAQWSIHVARPMILQIESKKDLEKYKDIGNLFMMSDAAAKEQPILRNWMNIAFDHIEDTYFCVVPESAEAASLLPPGKKSVSVHGRNIEVLPFEGSLSNEKHLKEWVNFNRWPVPVDATAEIIVKLMQSGYTIVGYVHKLSRFDNKRQTEIEQKFKVKAMQMRKARKHIFITVDTTQRENQNLLSKLFPGVSVPSIFVFAGNASYKSDILYWEDPTFKDGNDLSFERLETLMANDWARHDNSTVSWAKGYTKTIYRFGSGGVLGFFVVVCAPLTILMLCFCCIRELMRPDDPEEEEQLRKAREARVQRTAQQRSRQKRPMTHQDQRAMAEVKQQLIESEGLRERAPAKEGTEENKENPANEEVNDDKSPTIEADTKED